jgi:hypothetical protein
MKVTYDLRNGPLGRLRHRWNNNISTDIEDIVCKAVKWVHLAQVETSDGLL